MWVNCYKEFAFYPAPIGGKKFWLLHCKGIWLFAFLLTCIQTQLLRLRFSLCCLFKMIKICETYNWENYFTYSSAELGVTVSNRFVWKFCEIYISLKTIWFLSVTINSTFTAMFCVLHWWWYRNVHESRELQRIVEKILWKGTTFGKTQLK